MIQAFIERNPMIAGIIIGVLIPFVGYALLLSLNDVILANGNFGAGGEEPIFDQESLLLFAICLNLVPFTYFKRRYKNQAMRGVLTATLIAGFLWLFLFSQIFL